MQSVIKGKKKTSLSRNGGTICWTTIIDYEYQKLPKDGAKNTASNSAEGFNQKHEDNNNASSSSNGIAETEKKASQNDLSSEKPSSPSSLSLNKEVIKCENAEIQCELERNEPIAVIDMASIHEIYRELNSVFVKRIDDIELKVPHDVKLQIKTHEEWCKSLIKCSEAILEGVQNLKDEFKEFAAAPLVVSQTELKFENDRNSLIKFFQNYLRSGKWNFEELELETLPFKEILNPDSDYLSEVQSDSHKQPVERTKGRLKSPFTKT